MKFKNILLGAISFTAVMILAACGGNDAPTTTTTKNVTTTTANQTTTTTNPTVNTTTINTTTTATTTEEKLVLGSATINADSFEGDYHEYVLIGKTYRVAVTVKDDKGNEITSNDKLELKLVVGDGTTNMNGTWARVEETDEAGVFNLTPTSKGLDQHFNFFLNYRLKGDNVWKSTNYPSTVAIYANE